MREKAKKYIVVLLAVLFCCSGFTVAAMAGTAQGKFQYGTIQRNYVDNIGAGTQGNVQKETDQETDNTSSAPAQITLSFDLKGGSGLSNSKVDKGTKISELKTPVRSGYDFAGWTVHGKKVSDSYEMDSDTFLTATWTQNDDDTAAVSQSSTDSDADVSSSASSAVSSTVSSAASSASSAASAGGNFPMLFYVGILLVVMGIGGIVMLIVRQFHDRGGRGGGPRSSGGGGDDSMTFTDISSFSDGKKHHADSTMTGAQRMYVQPAGGAGAERNFDWERFFNEEKDR